MTCRVKFRATSGLVTKARELHDSASTISFISEIVKYVGKVSYYSFLVMLIVL